MKKRFFLFAINFLLLQSLCAMDVPRDVLCIRLVAEIPLGDLQDEATFSKLRDTLAFVLARIPPAGMDLANILFAIGVQIANVRVEESEAARLEGLGGIIFASMHLIPNGIGDGLRNVVNLVMGINPNQLTDPQKFQIIGAFAFRRAGQRVAPQLDFAAEFGSLSSDFERLKALCSLRGKGEREGDEALARAAIARMVQNLNNLEHSRIILNNPVHLDRLRQARAGLVGIQQVPLWTPDPGPHPWGPGHSLGYYEFCRFIDEAHSDCKLRALKTFLLTVRVE